MTTLSERNRQGDLILFEEDKDYSRETATIGTAADLKIGAVLGKITATGKYIHSTPAAIDGSQTPVAVLLEAANAAAADVTAVVMVRHARVRRSALNYAVAINTVGKRDTAVAALAAAGIIAV